ncbi:hypothetical protein GCM10009678_30010 [Actinomadura kijaniata]
MTRGRSVMCRSPSQGAGTRRPGPGRQVAKLARACRRIAGETGAFFAPTNVRRRALTRRALAKGPMPVLLDRLRTRAAAAIALKGYPAPPRPSGRPGAARHAATGP